MKTIESFLTHPNSLIRQLSRGLMELGCQNLEFHIVKSGNGFDLFSAGGIQIEIWARSDNNLTLYSSGLHKYTNAPSGYATRPEHVVKLLKEIEYGANKII